MSRTPRTARIPRPPRGPLTTLTAFAAVLVVAAAPSILPPAVPAADGPTTTEVAASGEALRAGFGTRTITPVGEVPEEWAEYITPHPETGVWGEPYEDLNGDGCYSGLTNEDLGPLLDGEQPTGAAPEPHVDQPWNSAGDGLETGAYEVRGVTIVGDPDSTGKWDGVWGNAGFGAKCALGMQDDTWARAVVLEVGDATVAMVSLDVVGLFNIEVQRMREELVARYPDMEIDELVVSSTHTHEGVDTMGYWGQLFLNTDGKFPAYQAFLRSQVLDAVHEAWSGLEPATVKLAKGDKPMHIRDSRPPVVTDDTVLSAQFLGADGGVLGTLVNWSNHPEAQGSNNPLVSSDFPHATRERLEQEYGGTAIYFTGAVGGLQTPLGVDIEGFGSDVSWERTYHIGELVAESAIAALDHAEPVEVTDLAARRRQFYLDSDNNVLRALVVRGVFDVPTFVGGDSWGSDTAAHTDGTQVPKVGTQIQTEMVQVEFGPAMFLTVPGELSPEIELGGYGRPECPEADTGRPFEPVIAHQNEEPFQFVLGLGQDELGYIIPGYDFHLLEAPGEVVAANGGPAGGPDVLPLGGLEQELCGEGHYEETVSISSVFAPWVGCVAAELAGADPWADEAACTRDNTSTAPYGIGGSDGDSNGQQQELSYEQARQLMIEALQESHGHSHLPAEQQADAGIDWEVEDAGSAHDAVHAEGTAHSH